MELTKIEMSVLEETVETSETDGKVQLLDLELALVGGGVGDIIFH